MTAKFSVVLIIPGVATAARPVGLGGYLFGCGMARNALQAPVGTVEQKTCCLIVVKFPKSPTIRVMAGAALIPQSLLVTVVFPVTTHTVRVCILECCIKMAFLTWHNRV